MSKAEELSRQYVLPFLDKQYEKYGEQKQMELSRFDGYDMMSAYEEGYHQAEKDLELTWEDMALVCKIEFSICTEYKGRKLPQRELFYQEILKRFREIKKK